MPRLRIRKTGQLFIDVGHSSSYCGESHGAHIIMALARQQWFNLVSFVISSTMTIRLIDGPMDRLESFDQIPLSSRSAFEVVSAFADRYHESHSS